MRWGRRARGTAGLGILLTLRGTVNGALPRFQPADALTPSPTGGRPGKKTHDQALIDGEVGPGWTGEPAGRFRRKSLCLSTFLGELAGRARPSTDAEPSSRARGLHSDPWGLS